MQGSARSGRPAKMDIPSVSGEEDEALRRLRVALQNPHGTATENRERVVSAWRSLRSVANSPDVEIKLQKRHQKRVRFEEKAKKKKKKAGNKNDGCEYKKAHSADPIKDEKNKLLHEAARMGQADRIRELISLGAKVSSIDTSGYSALHWASLYGHVEVVRELLCLGAGDGRRINRQNDAGNTALHLACVGHHAEVAVMLQMYKPDEHLLNACNKSPVSLGFRELVESVEKIRRLDSIQALHAYSNQCLLSKSSKWPWGRESRSARTIASDVRWEFDINKKVPKLCGGWEDYDTAWKRFVERFTCTSRRQDGAESKNSVPDFAGVEKSETDTIHFQEVPWPVTGIHILSRDHTQDDTIQDKGRLLVAELGLTGAALHTLVQRERLRWHPDKFLQLFGRHLASEDRSAILASVHNVCQLLNALADDTEQIT